MLFWIAAQLKVVLVTELDKLIAVVSPEQIVCPKTGFIVNVGIGLTLMVTSIGAPLAGAELNVSVVPDIEYVDLGCSMPPTAISV